MPIGRHPATQTPACATKTAAHEYAEKYNQAESRENEKMDFRTAISSDSTLLAHPSGDAASAAGPNHPRLSKAWIASLMFSVSPVQPLRQLRQSMFR